MIVAIAIVAMQGCKKEQDTMSYPGFNEFISKQSTLSMFSKAVEKANLKDFTTGPGPFTWFAPSDAAFAAAGITNDSLNRMTVGQVSFLMTYHLVNASFTSQQMLAVSSISRTTQMGQVVYSGSFGPTFFVNGAKISSLDNQLSNGYVHVVDNILTPPNLRGNIISILNSTGQHTLLLAALTRAGLSTALSGASVFTLMAPTDAAMNAAGFTATAIAATPVATLASLLRYHYFSSVRLFTNDFAANPITIATVAGPSTSLLASDNGTKIKGKGNATPFNITRANLLGTNGVVHVIDGVLRQ